jgi:hypothetical protein
MGSIIVLDSFVSAFWPWGKRELDRIPPKIRFEIEVILLYITIFYAGYAAWHEEPSKSLRNNDG